MNLSFKFNNLKPSRELSEYIEERLERLSKYEMKPIEVAVTMRVERGEKRVDIHASGEKLVLHSHGNGENFFESIDLAIHRLGKQMQKKKSKVQEHRCFERTHLGKLQQLSPSLSPKDDEEYFDPESEVA